MKSLMIFLCITIFGCTSSKNVNCNPESVCYSYKAYSIDCKTNGNLYSFQKFEVNDTICLNGMQLIILPNE